METNTTDKTNYTSDDVQQESTEFLTVAKLYLNLVSFFIISPILCFYGIVGNIIIIFIMVHHKFKESTNILIFTLAVIDFVFIVTQLMPSVMLLINEFDTILAYIILAYYKCIGRPVNLYTLMIAAYIVTLMTVERMIAVLFPFKVASLMTPRRTTITIVVTLCVLFGFYSPNFYLFDIEWYYSPEYNRTIGISVFSRIALNSLDVFFTLDLLFTLLFPTAIPPVVIGVCTVLIIAKLYFSSKTVAQMSSNALKKKAKDLKSVKMTLSLCVFIIAFRLFPTFTTGYVINHTDVHISANFLYLCAIWQNLSLLFGASVNLNLFIRMSPKFAKTYSIMFSGRVNDEKRKTNRVCNDR